MHCGTVKCNAAVHYSEVQCFSTLHYSAVQYRAVNEVQLSAVQFSVTVQFSSAAKCIVDEVIGGIYQGTFRHVTVGPKPFFLHKKVYSFWGIVYLVSQFT